MDPPVDIKSDESNGYIMAITFSNASLITHQMPRPREVLMELSRLASLSELIKPQLTKESLVYRESSIE